MNDLRRSTTKYSTQFSAYDVSDELFEEVESSCKMVEKAIQPQTMKNIFDQVVRIVNIDSYNQTLVVQECV